MDTFHVCDLAFDRLEFSVFHSVAAGDLVGAHFSRTPSSFALVGCRSSVSSVCACFTRLTTLLPAVMRLLFRAFVTPTRLLPGATDTGCQKTHVLLDFFLAPTDTDTNCEGYTFA